MSFAFTLLSLALINAVSAQSTSTALTCETVPIFPEANAPELTDFCRQYLGIRVETTTQLLTPVVTRTTTEPLVLRGVLTFFSEVSVTTATTTTESMSFTPEPSTTIATITSTAYLDNSGNTIFFAKRNAVPTSLPIVDESSLEKRQRVMIRPTLLEGYNRADLNSICSCGNLYNVAPTLTRTMAARPTVVLNTRVLTRRINTRTTDTVVFSATSTDTRMIVVTAAAPVVTNIFVSYIPSFESCPPNFDIAFLCPEGTGEAVDINDPEYDPNFNTCPVFAADGYSGSCLYWGDDGSPQASTLTFGNTGDATRDSTRAATYGNHNTDDCPSWSDYTCSRVNGDASTSTLTVIPNETSTAATTVAATTTTAAAATTAEATTTAAVETTVVPTTTAEATSSAAAATTTAVETTAEATSTAAAATTAEATSSAAATTTEAATTVVETTAAPTTTAAETTAAPAETTTPARKRSLEARSAEKIVRPEHVKQKMPAHVAGTRGSKYVHTGQH